MKNVLSVIIVILGIQFGFSTNPDVNQNRLTVVANSGLKLRTAPTLNSSVIKVIPFGDVVFEVIDTVLITDRIEWMEGEWIQVDHSGDVGYVFDGFLSSLPIPQHDFEYSKEDLMVIPPLDSWVSYRYDVMEEPKIYESGEDVTVVTNLSEGHRKIEKDTPYMFQLKLELSDVEIHEAYNLVKSMLSTGYEKTSFEQKSIFIENKYGVIDRIKIGLDEPIEIRKKSDNKIELIVVSFHEGCKL